jgi:hypothetical protein
VRAGLLVVARADLIAGEAAIQAAREPTDRCNALPAGSLRVSRTDL